MFAYRSGWVRCICSLMPEVLGICITLHLAAAALMWSRQVSAPAPQPDPVALRTDMFCVGDVYAADATDRMDWSSVRRSPD